MSRLASLPPTIGRLANTLNSNEPQEQTRSSKRYADAPWRKWYSLKRWKSLRWQVLVEAMFRCSRCGNTMAQSKDLVADHKVPHRGRPDLFWDRNNLVCMCKTCHDTIKQREEQSALVGVWD